MKFETKKKLALIALIVNTILMIVLIVARFG